MQSVTLQSLAGAVGSIEEKKKILIVNFIALLELLRSGSIQAEQSGVGDIEMYKIASS